MFLTEGVPLESLSKMMGHKNISTTQIYAKITSQKISKDMDLVSHKFSGMEAAFIEMENEIIVWNLFFTYRLKQDLTILLFLCPYLILKAHLFSNANLTANKRALIGYLIKHIEKISRHYFLMIFFKYPFSGFPSHHQKQ